MFLLNYIMFLTTISRGSIANVNISLTWRSSLATYPSSIRRFVHISAGTRLCFSSLLMSIASTFIWNDLDAQSVYFLPLLFVFGADYVSASTKFKFLYLPSCFASEPGHSFDQANAVLGLMTLPSYRCRP